MENVNWQRVLDHLPRERGVLEMGGVMDIIADVKAQRARRRK
jgi:hypothetical protein